MNAMFNKINNRIKAAEKIAYLMELDPSPDNLMNLLKTDTITFNTCRNGREVSWYFDGKYEVVIYTDDLSELTPAEIERELT